MELRFKITDTIGNTLSNALCIILIFFNISFSFVFSQKTLKVNYLNDDGIGYTDITTTSKIWISSDLKGKTRTPLYLDSLNGIFKIDSLPHECPYFYIEDQYGDIHIQKICIGLNTQKNREIFIGDENKVLYYFGSQGQSYPFNPIYDKIFLSHICSFNYPDEINCSKVWEKFRTLEVEYIGYFLYEMNPINRSEIISKLSKTEQINTMAPIISWNNSHVSNYSYFNKTVEFLFLNELTDEKINKLEKDLDIRCLRKKERSRFSLWRRFNSGIVYEFHLNQDSFMNYTFLRKISDLMLEDKTLLGVFTPLNTLDKKD